MTTSRWRSPGRVCWRRASHRLWKFGLVWAALREGRLAIALHALNIERHTGQAQPTRRNRSARAASAARQLLHDEFDFAPGRMLLVISRRVARAQIELVFVHVDGIAKEGCSTVSGGRLRLRPLLGGDDQLIADVLVVDDLVPRPG